MKELRTYNELQELKEGIKKVIQEQESINKEIEKFIEAEDRSNALN